MLMDSKMILPSRNSREALQATGNPHRVLGAQEYTPTTYINEGCIHIVCVFLAPLNWNDHSVEFICKKDSGL
jgi:hypothetical protein